MHIKDWKRKIFRVTRILGRPVEVLLIIFTRRENRTVSWWHLYFLRWCVCRSLHLQWTDPSISLGYSFQNCHSLMVMLKIENWKNGLRILILHPRLLFGQVLFKTEFGFGRFTLAYHLVKFYWKPWSDSDSAPLITFWSSFIENHGQIRIQRPRLPFGQVLLKTVVRFGFSTLNYPLVNFYWKPWSDSDSAPSISLWSSLIVIPTFLQT